MNKIKLVILAIVLLLVIVVMAANWEDVQVKLLVGHLEMPKAVRLLLTFILGVAVGALAPWRALKLRRKKPA